VKSCLFPLFLPTAVSDTVSLAAAGILAYTVRTSSWFDVHSYIINPPQYLLLLGTAILLWHVLMTAQGGYRPTAFLFRIDELVLQFKTSLLLLVLLTSATFIYHQYDYSRLIIFFGWLFFVLLGGIGRQFAHRLREGLHRRGIGRRHVLIAGQGDKRPLFVQRLRENPGLGIDHEECATEEVPTRIADQTFDEVFLFHDAVAYETIWQWRERSRNPHLNIHLVPTFSNLYLRRISGLFFDGMVMMSLDSPGAKVPTLVGKRLLDIFVSAVFLLLFSPLMLLIGLLIKLDSRGPVVFSQTRIGKDRVPFTIFKFRTMVSETEAYAVTPTSRADPRITRVGRFLRSTGLDELPQLYNVLRGDMSLVGPRPEMPFIVDAYSDLEMKRLKVRPGITGLWQVYARTSLLPIHQHIEYDLYYIENLSLVLDAMILLDTLPTLILRTGI